MFKDVVKIMIEEHTIKGKIAIISGIIGLILVFFVNYIPFILALIAISLGISARNRGDKYGTYGLILGILTFIATIIIAALVYFYITSLLPG